MFSKHSLPHPPDLKISPYSDVPYVDYSMKIDKFILPPPQYPPAFLAIIAAQHELMENMLYGTNWPTSPPVHGGPPQKPGSANEGALTAAHIAAMYRALARPHEPAKTTLKSSGIRAGEIEAWRVWDVNDDGYISSCCHRAIWSFDRPMVGDPSFATAGVYALKTEALAREYMESWPGFPRSYKSVLGTVDLWGDVVEHEIGYRAEFARPTSFVIWHRVPGDLQRLITANYLTNKATIDE